MMKIKFTYIGYFMEVIWNYMPILRKIFKIYFSIFSSSTEEEIVFSLMKNIITPKRTLLKEDIIVAMIFIKLIWIINLLIKLDYIINLSYLQINE